MFLLLFASQLLESVLLGWLASCKEAAEIARQVVPSVLALPSLDLRTTAWRAEFQQCSRDPFTLPQGGLDEERLRLLCVNSGQRIAQILTVDTSAFGNAFR